MNVISKWKKTPKVSTGHNKPVKKGYERVMVSEGGQTRHIDILKKK